MLRILPDASSGWPTRPRSVPGRVYRCGRPATREAGLMTSTEKTATGERADLLQTLANHRCFLRFTVRDLTDEQAAQRTTVSELCLGGLIKHVAGIEQAWMDFALRGAE